jgi:hypothetical protein
MAESPIGTVFVTAITVLGSASAWRYWERRAMKKEKDEDFMKSDCHCFALGVANNPMIFIVFDDIGRVHPVQRFVGASIGVDGNASVGLHHDESQSFRQTGLQATGIFHGATRYKKSHVPSLADEVPDGESVS